MSLSRAGGGVRLGRAGGPAFAAGLLLLASSHEASQFSQPSEPSGSAPGRLGPLADPSPLTAEEEAHPRALALARSFNPAMVLPQRDVWPVEVRYAWHDGADLVARVQSKQGKREYVAVAGQLLDRVDWSYLPSQTPDGEEVRYYVDAPGDDRPAGNGLSRWRQRWREIVQPDGLDAPPTASPYPPTQYAHLFWWNRERGLLAIQYWFYYPFNEWVNNHEADWERIQIVVAGPRSLEKGSAQAFSPVGYQFFFHDSWLETEEVTHFAQAGTTTAHPVIFVGGRGRMFAWEGPFSGGSYPVPGVYPNAGFRPTGSRPPTTFRRASG